MGLQRKLISTTKPLRYWLDSKLYNLRCDKTPLMQLKDLHYGKPMLVVGNGPSINKTPLEDFCNTPSIGMNKIDLLFDRTSWRPEVIVCTNSVVAQQHQDSFVRSDIPVFVSWKSRRLLKPQNRDRINYFDLTASNAFSVDAASGFGSSATVSYIALQMAYWMGANPVIIFGIDHSFKYTGTKATYQKRVGQDENHFDPNYFKSGSIWGTPDLDQSEVEYALARKAFELNNRTILDATIDGKLKIFDKISLDKAKDITRA